MNDAEKTAFNAVLGSLLRKGITVVGTLFVAKGYLDKDTANNAAGPIGDYLLGVLSVGGSALWGALQARAAHWKWVQALNGKSA